MSMADKSIIGHRDLLMLLIGLRQDGQAEGAMGGMTRLQKFLFMLEKEEKIIAGVNGFEFTPYDAGPYSSRLYDDLEFLENLGFITSEVTSEAVEEEKPDTDAMGEEIAFPDFGDLMEGNTQAPDKYEERRFNLTEKGRQKVEQLLAKADYKPFVIAVTNIKRKYSDYSLSDLLYYIYTKYPEMATASKIRDKVLSRKGRHGTR